MREETAAYEVVQQKYELRKNKGKKKKQTKKTRRRGL